MIHQEDFVLLPLYLITIWAFSLCAAAAFGELLRNANVHPIRKWRRKRRTRQIWKRNPNTRPRGRRR